MNNQAVTRARSAASFFSSLISFFPSKYQIYSPASIRHISEMYTPAVRVTINWPEYMEYLFNLTKICSPNDV